MFLYFLPSDKPITPATLIAEKISHALEAGRINNRQLITGPTGTAGNILSHASHPLERCIYAADNQRWRRIPGSSAWIGRWSDDIITPTELVRPDVLRGVDVTLEDGCVWHIAHARKFSVYDGQEFFLSALPHALEYNEDGQWTPTKVTERYRRVEQLADQYWESMIEASRANPRATTLRFSFPEIDEFAIAAVSLNYRVSHCELDMLGAYSVAVRQKIIDATLDTSTFAAFTEKKTDEAHDGIDS